MRKDRVNARRPLWRLDELDFEVLSVPGYAAGERYGFENAFTTSILLAGSIENDDYIFSYGFEDAFTTPILLVGVEQNDDYIFSYGFEDAYLENKLVTGYVPDHGLTFIVDLDSANCSMVDV